MNWDVHVWRDRDGYWRARIGTWRSDRHYHVSQLMTAVGYRVLEQWSTR